MPREIDLLRQLVENQKKLQDKVDGFDLYDWDKD